jgi:hypothetical protein
MATIEELNVEISKIQAQLTDIDKQTQRKKDPLQRKLNQINVQKDRMMKQTKEVEEEAQAAITTGSVGNAASAGGEANFAPSMGTLSRVGFTKPVKRKKKKKIYKEYIETFFDN